MRLIIEVNFPVNPSQQRLREIQRVVLDMKDDFLDLGGTVTSAELSTAAAETLKEPKL